MVSYITNLDGTIVQHIEYVPFGEVFIEERNNTWNSPYLFNGKELDEDTGFYYYGARYYNPRESIFLSVDQMVELTMTPYQYAYQNTVNYTDPTGMMPEGGPEKGGEPKKETQLDEIVITANKKPGFWKGFGRGVGSFFTGIWKGVKRWPSSVGLRGKAKAVEVYKEETQERLESANFIWDVAYNSSEVLEAIKSNSEAQGEIVGSTTVALAAALVTRGKGTPKDLPKVVRKEWIQILKGRGTPISGRNGVQKILENRSGVSPKWVGSLEWKSPDVPGSTINGTRILQHPDGRWGYAINHDYTKIIAIPISSPVPIKK